MFFNSIRQTNRLLKEINRLLRKINSLLSKGMSNIYEKVTTERKWPTQNFYFFFFFFFQLTQILLNFQISCYKLKIRGLGASLSVALLSFLFWKELWRFKFIDSIHFIEQKYNLW